MSTARTPIPRPAPEPTSPDLRWTCDEARLWSQAFELRATVEERMRFHAHLRACSPCRAHFTGIVPIPPLSKPRLDPVKPQPRLEWTPVPPDLRAAAEPALRRSRPESAATWVRIAGWASILVVLAIGVLAWRLLTPQPLPTALAVEGELSYHPAGDVLDYLLPSVELKPGDEVWCGPLDSGVIETPEYEIRLGSKAGLRFDGFGPGGIRVLNGDVEILGHLTVRTPGGKLQVEGGRARMLIEDTGVRIKALHGQAWVTDRDRETHTLSQGQSIALSLTEPKGGVE